MRNYVSLLDSLAFSPSCLDLGKFLCRGSVPKWTIGTVEVTLGFCCGAPWSQFMQKLLQLRSTGLPVWSGSLGLVRANDFHYETEMACDPFHFHLLICSPHLLMPGHGMWGSPADRIQRHKETGSRKQGIKGIFQCTPLFFLGTAWFWKVIIFL